MLQKGYLDQIGVEFRQQVIDAIVNLPTLKWRTLRGSMSLFEGILMLQKGYLNQNEVTFHVIGPIVNLDTPTESLT